MKLRRSVCVLSIPLFTAACGDTAAAPATYDDAIDELVCSNPGTTFEDMDAETCAYAERQNMPPEDVAREAVPGEREEISVDGEFGGPCR
ncbi:MAG: hypothetical protein WAX14_13585 [Rhodococcus sp. (in: high G+C Gram-positive bacteria)]|uniref:hypothetical protein n=1 Tax=Rhodococcus sp. TaxID=1831 RepID=UPI003BB781B5